MNKDKLIEFLKQKSISVPLLFFQNYKKLNLTLEEFLFLMYLKNQGDIFPFDPNEMSSDLGYSMSEIMGLLSSLSDKKMITVETFKNDKGIMEEQVNLTQFYEKVSMLFVEQWNAFQQEKVETDDSHLFEAVEREFGRTLSPSEVEVMKAWLTNFNQEVILEAVKEAVLNGVSSVRYIDKILYEWDRKGLKSREDIVHMLKERRKETADPVEVFDYDWFDEDEEE